MIRLLASIVALMLLSVTTASVKADSFIQLALWAPDIQLVSESESIGGLRLEVYGRNDHMTGLDLGFAHESMGDFKGLGAGLVNLTEGNVSGLHAGVFNQAKGEFQGIQTSAVGFALDNVYGLQASFLYNRADKKVSGLQVGAVNRADVVSGVQLGVVNIAEEMKGLQFGLWNQISSKEKLKVFPIVNWNF